MSEIINVEIAARLLSTDVETLWQQRRDCQMPGMLGFKSLSSLLFVLPEVEAYRRKHNIETAESERS